MFPHGTHMAACNYERNTHNPNPTPNPVWPSHFFWPFIYLSQLKKNKTKDKPPSYSLPQSHHQSTTFVVVWSSFSVITIHQPQKTGSKMEVSSIWDTVVELIKVAQQKGSDPLVWVLQLSSNLSSRGVSMPSVELANVLVSHICWENNVPIMWKFLEKALMLKIVPPMLVLALLSQRFVLLFSILVFQDSVFTGFWCCWCEVGSDNRCEIG